MPNPPAPPPDRTVRKPRIFTAGKFQISFDMPRVMGILNVTPDSFSDGGAFLDAGLAEEHALRMEREGAAVIDVGGESSRPGARPISAEEECSRVLPVLKRIVPRLGIPVSVDTTKFEVMERALNLGVSIVNDIAALGADPRAAGLIGRSGAGVVLMHKRGEPATMQHDTGYADLIEEVARALETARRRAIEGGISADAIFVDPGIGFGKSPEGNVELLKNLSEFKERLDAPVLVGLSKKSFLRNFLGEDLDLKSATNAAHAYALLHGADMIRVHDTADAQSVARLMSSFCQAGVPHA